MRRVLLRTAVLITLAAMLGGHVTELFDRWDNTPRTGNEIDFTIVLVAACAGFAFVIAKSLVSLFRRSRKSAISSSVQRTFSAFQTLYPETSAAGPSPPPLLPLRI